MIREAMKNMIREYCAAPAEGNTTIFVGEREEEGEMLGEVRVDDPVLIVGLI